MIKAGQTRSLLGLAIISLALNWVLILEKIQHREERSRMKAQISDMGEEFELLFARRKELEAKYDQGAACIESDKPGQKDAQPNQQ